MSFSTNSPTRHPRHLLAEGARAASSDRRSHGCLRRRCDGFPMHDGVPAAWRPLHRTQSARSSRDSRQELRRSRQALANHIHRRRRPERAQVAFSSRRAPGIGRHRRGPRSAFRQQNGFGSGPRPARRGGGKRRRGRRRAEERSIGGSRTAHTARRRRQLPKSAFWRGGQSRGRDGSRRGTLLGVASSRWRVGGRCRRTAVAGARTSRCRATSRTACRRRRCRR